MPFELSPDQPTSPESCQAATGHPYDHWFQVIETAGFANKRREAIQLIYDALGRGKDTWWATTIWVEYERAKGVLKKDGRPEGYNICCTKGFAQTPEQIFPHFAAEEAMRAWAPEWSGAMTEGSAFRCGGCTGVIGRIRPNKDIRMTWETPGFGPSEIEVQFTVTGAKTTVNIFHKRMATRDEADGFRRGWGEALDRLKALVR